MLRRQLAAGEIARHAETGDLVGGQSPGPQPPFLAAAEENRLQVGARLRAHVERTDALGTVELVRGDGHEVDRQAMHVERDLAGRLRGIAVEEHAARATERADRGDVLRSRRSRC